MSKLRTTFAKCVSKVYPPKKTAKSKKTVAVSKKRKEPATDYSIIVEGVL
jgi:hypothetical protein